MRTSSSFGRGTFLYLDVPSWLESKVTGVPVEAVIRKKFLENVRGGKA
jgi:hypothetical protein